MYEEAKTVSSDVDLYLDQINNTAQMRNQLISFNKNDPNAAKKAIQNITILRVYHQITRIIRYTEMMDKLEEKLYEAMDAHIESADPADPTALFRLVALQEKLQKNMIDSHKLLEPYLDMNSLNVIEVTSQEDPTNTFAAMIMDQESREKLRNSAQAVLNAISLTGGANDPE